MVKEKSFPIEFENRFFVHEEDPEIQKLYFERLDKIIDAIALMRYREEPAREFITMSQIHEKVLYWFSYLNLHNEEYLFNHFANSFVLATRRIEEKPMYIAKLKQLYSLYQKNPILPKEQTTAFYNDILNKQQNFFCAEEKRVIIEILKDILPFTPQKEQQLIRTLKLQKMNALLKKMTSGNKTFFKEDLEDLIDEIHINLSKNKYLKKQNITMTQEQIVTLDELFLSGKLTPQAIKDMFPSKIVKIIVNQYYKHTLPLLDEMEISMENIKPSMYSYSYQHLLFASNEKTKRNIQQLVQNFNIDPEILEQESNQEFLKLLPLVNLLEEFDTNVMVAMLKNSEKILNQLKKEDETFDGTISNILNRFFKVIDLAKAYAATDEYVMAAFGMDVIDEILNGRGYTSSNPSDYVPIYCQMLAKKQSVIPSIQGKYQNYTFESGRNADLMRLLIGKKCRNSCLGPDGAGAEAFCTTLTKENADVLLIKNQEENFVARAVMFRKGNFVIISSIRGEHGIMNQFYNQDFLSIISSAILEQAVRYQDSIDYVFLVKNTKVYLDDYSVLKDERLESDLPHCDWEKEAYLIGSRKKEVLLVENQPMSVYPQWRNCILEKREQFVEDIKKVHALQILMEQDKEKKEQLQGVYKNLDFQNIKTAYIGQDWYMAITKDEQIEGVILPSFDERQQIEINETVEEIVNKEAQPVTSYHFSKLKK